MVCPFHEKTDGTDPGTKDPAYEDNQSHDNYKRGKEIPVNCVIGQAELQETYGADETDYADM
jgi:hypothetical protein